MYTLTTIRDFKILHSNGSPVKFITEEEALAYAKQISNGETIYIPLKSREDY